MFNLLFKIETCSHNPIFVAFFFISHEVHKVVISKEWNIGVISISVKAFNLSHLTNLTELRYIIIKY